MKLRVQDRSAAGRDPAEFSPVDREFRLYWLSVRAAVCTACIDGDGFGSCNLDSSIECPVRAFLLQVADLVGRAGGSLVDEYASDLRAIVCSNCLNKTGGGVCSLRGEIACPLMQYFDDILGAVERVNRRLAIHARHDWDDESDCQ